MPRPVILALRRACPVDASPDGKAIRQTADTDRMVCGRSALVDNLTTFTAFILHKPSSHSTGRQFFTKNTTVASDQGWRIAQNGTTGQLWLRWGRTTTALSYITAENVFPLGSYSVAILTVDQGGAAGALAQVEYGRWGGPPKIATFSTATDGSGTYRSDASQELVIGSNMQLINAARGDFAYVALFPKLTLRQRLAVLREPLSFRGLALGFWRPGHNGMSRVRDESGNGFDGTITGGIAVSGIPQLWAQAEDERARRVAAAVAASSGWPDRRRRWVATEFG